MIGSGTAKVKIEIVKKGPYTKLSSDTAKSAAKIMAKISGNSSNSKTITQKNNSVKIEQGKIYDIQLASFSTKENAVTFARKVKKDGFQNIVLQSNSKTVRVTISKIKASEVSSITKELDSKGYKDYLIKERK